MVGNRSSYYSFHEGALAGLDAQERRARQSESWYYSHSQPRRFNYDQPEAEYGRLELRNLSNADPGASLQECLYGCTVKQLRDRAQPLRLYLGGVTRKANIVERVAAELVTSPQTFDRLMYTLDVRGASIIAQAAQEGVAEEQEELPCPQGLHDFPYVFLRAHDSKYVWHMPEEIRAVVSVNKVKNVVRELIAYDEFERMLFNQIMLCGIVSVADLHSLYEALGNQLSEEEFLDVVKLHVKRTHHPFCLIKYEDGLYVAYERSGNGYGHAYNNAYGRGNTFDEFESAYGHKYEKSNTWPEASWSDESIGHMVRAHSQIPMRGATDVMTGGDVGNYLYGLPCVQALAGYFDAHIPYDENEYTFADEMVDKLLTAFIVQRRSLASVLEWLTKHGWYLSEGSNMAPQLTSLVVQLHKNIPRWELNGWTENEYTDMQGFPCLVSDSQRAWEELDLVS